MNYLVFLAMGIVAFLLGYLFRGFLTGAKLRSAEAKAGKLLAEAQTKCKEVILEAKDEAIRIRDEVEAENNRRRIGLQKQESRLQRQRESLDHRLAALERRERQLEAKERQLDLTRDELKGLRQQRMEELERVSTMSREEAKELLLQAIEEEARQDAARVIREVELQVREEADRRAREIITSAIQRCASDYVAETTVSTVPLPNDEMKGRIIGRGGRNIRAMENIMGVDLVVDDTPEAITLSCFDPVRREVARVALTRLILDGRIHPARIEKVVKEVQEEIENLIREEGEQAAYALGIHDLHPELIKLLGQLKYRTSYGQNVLAHSMETARLAAMMAAELRADVEVTKKAGLLHDIGKAINYEVDGPHALIGADIARRFGVSPAVANAIAAHHEEEEPQSMEAILVEAADAISSARPGARRETLESYIKRINALEEIAASFDGVSQAYAIQAGREIRIMVRPEEIDDLAAIRLSKDIARKVEEGLEYPGQIKVTVIRETRAIEYAQ